MALHCSALQHWLTNSIFFIILHLIITNTNLISLLFLSSFYIRRTSADLHDFVENDKSHVTHFWEAVRTSVHASGHFDGERHSKFKKKMNELEVADSRTNADEIRQKMLFNPDSKHKTGWDFYSYPCDIYSNKSSVENCLCYR